MNKKPLISIIIPTCNDFVRLLKPCLDSIERYTDLSNIEIIVVNNAPPNEEKIFFINLPEYIKVISYPLNLGYPRAVNRGIEIAEGKYILLLNNDTILLDQPKNQWINQLITPFFTDEKVGITGVFKKNIPEINRNFILFFCTLISREVIDNIGLLDESFGLGYCEDMLMSLKAEDMGYKCVSVPTDEIADNFEGHLYISDFQIYHAHRKTMDLISDAATSSYNRNFKRLIEKYAQ